MINDCDGSPQIIAGLTGFTPAIPKFYWDVDSQEQGIKQLCKTIGLIVDFLDQVSEQVNSDATSIEELKALFAKFQESGFEDYYKQQLAEWFDNNAGEIYKRLVTQVYFGLTEDGRFCAYVPESWSDVTFDTGAVYGRSDYGRLILQFEADPAAQGVINNGYPYTLNDWGAISGSALETLNKLVADVETTANRTDIAYNTLFTNLDS